MPDHSNHRPSGRWALAITLALALVTAACSRESAAPRTIRAHARVIGGVSHASPAGKPVRYCQGCHGRELAGGDERFVAASGTDAVKPPSCFTCHGKTWTDEQATAAAAPPTHSVVMAWPGEGPSTGIDDASHLAFRHDPGLFAPGSACVSCHGASLAGDDPDVGGTRSGCQLCHGDLWDERTPSPTLNLKLQTLSHPMPSHAATLHLRGQVP